MIQVDSQSVLILEDYTIKHYCFLKILHIKATTAHKPRGPQALARTVYKNHFYMDIQH